MHQLGSGVSKWITRLVVCTALGMAAVGCGDDDAAHPPTDDAGAGNGGRGGNGGAGDGGRGGSAGGPEDDGGVEEDAGDEDGG